MKRIPPQTIVELDGRRGVTCPDLPGIMACCSPEQTPVVWDGTKSFDGTETSKLTVIGPENAQADFHKCGAGREAECCIFLTAGPDGACCERYSDLRMTLIMKTMRAERSPVEPYPACQKFPASTRPNKSE